MAGLGPSRRCRRVDDSGRGGGLVQRAAEEEARRFKAQPVGLASGRGGALFALGVCTGLFAGLLQICVNTFVFITWTNGFIKERGFRKIIPVFGVVIPFIMAAITLCRVIVPAVFN